MANSEYKSRLDDTSKFAHKPLEETAEPIIIKAIGVGGGGNNAVDHMYETGIKNVSYVNINTDAQALRNSCVPQTLVIGNGLGAGNDPEVARQVAEEAEDKIRALFDDDTKMVFITAGMGGGTGTGAAPVIARIARELDLLTIGIVTIPFLFEGPKKIMKALGGADEMSKYVDALLVINNERLTDIYPDLDIINGFAKADDTLTTAARSISELITSVGHINVDFNDVNTTLRSGGSAIISTGFGEGQNRVANAIEDALKSPLLKNRDIMGSKKLLFNLYFSPEADEKFQMSEVDELTSFVTTLGGDVDVIWGLSFDNSLGNQVKITVLAAGFDVSLESEEDDLLQKRTRGLGQKRGGGRLPDPVRPARNSTSGYDEDRFKKEYGQKATDYKESKDRTRYIVLNPDQFDDDDVIDILEKYPTATRDKKIVERVRNAVGTMRHADSADGKSSDNNPRINFLG